MTIQLLDADAVLLLKDQKKYVSSSKRNNEIYISVRRRNKKTAKVSKILERAQFRNFKKYPFHMRVFHQNILITKSNLFSFLFGFFIHGILFRF